MKMIFKSVFCLVLALSFAVLSVPQSFAFSYDENQDIKPISDYFIKEDDLQVNGENTADNSFSGKTVLIDGYEYIQSQFLPEMNYYGTGGAVAGLILLKYYQHYLGNFLIPNSDVSATSRYNWSIGNNTYHYTDPKTGIEVDIPWEFDPMKSIDENTHRYLYDLMEQTGETLDYSFGVTATQICGGLTDYFSGLVCLNNMTFGSQYYENKTEAFTALINNNTPFIANMRKINHAVVVYGYYYCEQSDEYFYIINPGYKGISYLLCNESELGNYVVFCNSDMKNVTCSHDLVYDVVTSSRHNVICTVCDYDRSGFHQKQYYENDSETHTVSCSECGWSISEEHIFENDACKYCGYIKGGNDETLEDGGVMD